MIDMLEKVIFVGLVFSLIPTILGNRNLCYDGLGCFTSHNILTTPSSRSDIDTTFELYTRQESLKAPLLDASNLSTIKSSTFKGSRPTKFVVHGFKNYGNGTSYQVLIDNLLAYGDYNVIKVVWGKGAQGIYLQAAMNTFVVGLEVAHMITTLQGHFGLNVSDIHLIGHSLGAHVMGHAGSRIPGISRITGLDPAGPLFENWESDDRLDASDADFVDVVHTSGSSGMQRAIGHLDFYPNGGKLQPGCGSLLGDLVDSCSHGFAIDIFADSMMATACQSIAYQCDNYLHYEEGQCASCGEDNSECSRFGIAADSYPLRSRTGVKLYLDSASASPYCEYAYRVKINLAHPLGASRWVNGILSIDIKGANGQINEKQLSKVPQRFVHGKGKTYLFSDPLNVGLIRNITLKWKYVNNFLRPSTLCGLFCSRSLHVGSVEVSQLNSYPESALLANTVKFCPAGSFAEDMPTGSVRTFSFAC